MVHDSENIYAAITVKHNKGLLVIYFLWGCLYGFKMTQYCFYVWWYSGLTKSPPWCTHGVLYKILTIIWIYRPWVATELYGIFTKVDISIYLRPIQIVLPYINIFRFIDRYHIYVHSKYHAKNLMKKSYPYKPLNHPTIQYKT